MPPDSFLHLPEADRKEALEFAASETGRPANLLEKDVWVVKSLDILFSSPYGPHLVFKGGTALSKVHKVITRFSEDIDVTYDIRQLVHETERYMHELDVVPPNRSQQSKLTNLIRKERLPNWLEKEVMPLFSSSLSTVPGIKLYTIASDGSPGIDTLVIEYPAVIPASTYALPRVILEFGGRSTGEPATASHVVCDMAHLFSDLIFPTAEPRTMDVSRIFWEKATAIHVYCLQGNGKIAHRFSRHFYDFMQLSVHDHAKPSIAARDVAKAVAEHKGMFFREKSEDAVIDYSNAVSGGLRLVPEGEALEALRQDYQAMISEGLLRTDTESFDFVISHCLAIQGEANRAAQAPSAVKG
jgi:Nucleotidyl transferase AbiEii toxin, Type IV TA system